MQISSNLNSLMQLEKRLEESTEELAKLTRKEESGNNQEEKNIQQDLKDNNSKEQQPEQEKITEDVPVYNRDIALAYSVDHNVVSVQTTEHQSVLDIKV